MPVTRHLWALVGEFAVQLRHRRCSTIFVAIGDSLHRHLGLPQTHHRGVRISSVDQGTQGRNCCRSPSGLVSATEDGASSGCSPLRDRAKRHRAGSGEGHRDQPGRLDVSKGRNVSRSASAIAGRPSPGRCNRMWGGRHLHVRPSTGRGRNSCRHRGHRPNAHPVVERRAKATLLRAAETGVVAR